MTLRSLGTPKTINQQPNDLPRGHHVTQIERSCSTTILCQRSHFNMNTTVSSSFEVAGFPDNEQRQSLDKISTAGQLLKKSGFLDAIPLDRVPPHSPRDV